MIITVIVLNCIIALFCFYLAWKVWQLRLSLAKAANALIKAERETHSVLHNAPELILKGQIGAYELRQRYQSLEPQFQRARQALVVLGAVQQLLRRSGLLRARRQSIAKRQGKRRSRLTAR